MNEKQTFVVGRTLVRVMKVTDDGKTINAFNGVVVSVGDKFLRVYNFDRPDKGGEASIFASQFYPITSPRMWLEKAGELKVPIFIPADL